VSGPTVVVPTSDTGPRRPYRMQDSPPPAAREGLPRRFPRARGIAAARSYARSRDGLVSFAVVDSRGRPHGLAAGRGYVSASVVKVMLLAAELDRLRSAGLPLDPATRRLLSAMITYSDNDAADSIYYRVGDDGLFAVARRARMRDFRVSGYWANAEISARDMAGLMDGLDRVLVGPHADFAARLLAAIVPAQRWGIPAVAPEGWRVRFKGGWRGTERGQLVHQVARLECGRREIALAVLTDGQPTMTYGIETVREIAERLLSRAHPVCRGTGPAIGGSSPRSLASVADRDPDPSSPTRTERHVGVRAKGGVPVQARETPGSDEKRQPGGKRRLSSAAAWVCATPLRGSESAETNGPTCLSE
jgi:Beta-lactamase enzyme family